MSRTLAAVTLAVLACAACKGRGTNDSTTRTTETAQAAPAAEITVIGCVQPSDRSAPGTAGTSGHTADASFVLTRAIPAPNSSGASGSAAGSNQSTGTSGSTSGSQPVTAYPLDTNAATLAPQVGHEVEIVALVEPPDCTAPAGSGASATSQTASPRLKVETIRMIVTMSASRGLTRHSDFRRWRASSTAAIRSDDRRD